MQTGTSQGSFDYSDGEADGHTFGMSHTQRDSKVGKNGAHSHRIMEFVFPGEIRQQLPLLLSMVSHLSRTADERWLTCIGPAFLSKRDCLRSQVNWQRLLQVIPTVRHGDLELAERALRAGKSHTVICLTPSAPTPHQRYRLERAAGAGRCNALLIHGGQA